VNPVAKMIGDTILRGAAGLAAQAILASPGSIRNVTRTQARLLIALHHHPFFAVLVDLNVGQPRLELFVDASPPEIAGLVAMTVCRDHQILVRIIRPRRALPAWMARSLEAPAVLFIDGRYILIHRDSLDSWLNVSSAAVRDAPLKKGELWIGVVVMFEHGLDRSANPDGLARIAQEIAQHAHAAGVRQLDHDDDVGARVPEGGVHGMPGAGPAVDHPLRHHGNPFQIETL